MDRKKEIIERCQYDFAGDGGSTAGLPNTSPKIARSKPASNEAAEIVSDHTTEEYMPKVETVREGMRQGNYYEVILRQTFSAPFARKPVGAFSPRSEIQSESLRIYPADGR